MSLTDKKNYFRLRKEKITDSLKPSEISNNGPFPSEKSGQSERSPRNLPSSKEELGIKVESSQIEIQTENQNKITPRNHEHTSMAQEIDEILKAKLEKEQKMAELNTARSEKSSARGLTREISNLFDSHFQQNFNFSMPSDDETQAHQPPFVENKAIFPAPSAVSPRIFGCCRKTGEESPEFTNRKFFMSLEKYFTCARQKSRAQMHAKLEFSGFQLACQ